jgi:hypothetical protein
MHTCPLWLGLAGAPLYLSCFFLFFITSFLFYYSIVFEIDLKIEFDQKLLKLTQKNTNKISADSLFNEDYFGTTFKIF